MPWDPWLQLNWELQNGGETATEVRSAGRKLESETAIQEALEKRFAEWRGISTKPFPTKWHRRKPSNVRSMAILWTLSRLRGTIPRAAFPPTVLSTYTHPTLPHFLHISPCLCKALTAPSVLSAAGATLPGSHISWWKPKWVGDKEQGQERRKHLDGERKPQTCVWSDELNLARDWEHQWRTTFQPLFLFLPSEMSSS